MKIVVLCGGLSTERKISILSGTKICKALRRKGQQAVLVDLFLGLEDMGEELLQSPERLFDELPEIQPAEFDGIAPDLDAVRESRKWKDPSIFGRGVLEICKKADIVFLALHGLNGEDGRVQAAFDLMGIRYTGSGYLGAAVAMDKIITKKLVRPLGIRTPDWKEYANVTKEMIPQIAAENEAPCVVKTPTGGSSVGVYIVKEQKDLEPALQETLRYSKSILVEQFIEGKEFTNAVLKDRALPCVEINPKDGGYDYSNKYKAGATEEICPGRLAPEQAEEMGNMARDVHRILGLRTYSRSDFMVTADGTIYFLEVNTLPGMTPTSLVPQEAAAVGISYEDLCDQIVGDAVAYYEHRGESAKQ